MHSYACPLFEREREREREGERERERDSVHLPIKGRLAN